MTGIALGLPALAPKATCGVPTTATVAATIGAATAITIFDRILKRNMCFLASLSTVVSRHVPIAEL
jgi:hypothetical protein